MEQLHRQRHSTNNYGQTTATAQNSNGGKAVGASGPNGSGDVAKSANGDMYATKDGNVYSNRQRMVAGFQYKNGSSSQDS